MMKISVLLFLSLICCLQLIGGEIYFKYKHGPPAPFGRRRKAMSPVRLTVSAGRRSGSLSDGLALEQDSLLTDKKDEHKFWPPWPFNLLASRSSGSEVSKITVLSEYLRQRAIFCLYGIQTVTSEASLHFPPAAPALILLAIAPNAKFTKQVTFGSLGLALLSWGQDEICRVRQTRNGLIECNLYHKEQVMLPPFLPEDEDDNHELKALAKYDDELSLKGNSTWVSMQTRLNLLKRQRIVQQRERIMLELQALKEMKKISNDNNSYALVTGASRGLGRAISVELARRQINLILVARDNEKLLKLANDLEDYYDVKCHTIQADLSEDDAPQRIFNATSGFGLNVDILINNAGLSTKTEFADEKIDHLNTVVNVNILSSMRLSHLYINKMRNHRKGAVMFVSSITGYLPGCPSAALYAATKAFERSLALGLSNENEKNGIAVTLLSPGAISGTDFAQRGEFSNALCWKIPFYPKSPELVAKVGIDALSEGKLECVPGWQNRFAVRILQPMLPQKFMLGVGQMAWQPLKKSLPVWLGGEMVFFERVLSPETETNDPNTKREQQIVPMEIKLTRRTPQPLLRDNSEDIQLKSNITIDDESKKIVSEDIEDFISIESIP